MVRTRGPSVKRDLLRKSREAALNTVQTFNNPLAKFKSKTFIVLMVIAWTYLLHAYYWSEDVEYLYYRDGPKQRKFDRTQSGAFKHWELGQCLKENRCPLDKPTKFNLRFLIGLRNEIERHGAAGADDQFLGRYLACCLNYERYICELFGKRHSLGDSAAFTLQFRDFTATEIFKEEAVAPLPSNVVQYLQEFDAELSEEEIKSPCFRRKFLFVPVVTSKGAQADAVIEFVQPDSDLGKLINESYQVLLKEVERPKYLLGQIVKLMHEEGYTDFKMHYHTRL